MITLVDAMVQVTVIKVVSSSILQLEAKAERVPLIGDWDAHDKHSQIVYPPEGAKQ